MPEKAKRSSQVWRSIDPIFMTEKMIELLQQRFPAT